MAQPAGVPVLALDSSGRIMVDAEHIVYHVERQYETLLEVINQPASQWQPIERKAVTIGQIGEPV
ncbi:MAG: hypothetical protein SV765_13325 [Pseudomonadota bacterium]|nr:hypothetical protein [Pseudomonadota bacterium]